MPSFGETLDRYKGLGPGFDCLRIGLATSIVISHSFLLTGNLWFRVQPTWFAEYALVPMFFALSGFLIAGSAMRLSLKNFLINRSLRILPALAVDVVVCALIIGPLVTTLPLHAYFTDARLYKYFINVTGWIHYWLPGVFQDHPDTMVNGALWTVPYEMMCYCLMSALILTRIIGKPKLVAGIAIAMLLIGLAVEQFGYLLPHLADRVLVKIFVHRGGQIVLAFIMGIMLYQVRYHIPYSKRIAAVCVALCLVAIVVLDDSAMDRVSNRFIILPAVVYITIFLGLTPIPIPRILHTGDYSYGVYLYHDPLLQVIIGLVPGIVLIRGWGALVLAALGLSAVALLAIFSWHVVERPILALRKRFSFVARVRGVASNKDISVAPISPPQPIAARAPNYAGAMPAETAQ